MKNLQDTVASVQNAPSSIFTKDDVLNLLNGIEIPKEAVINPLTDFQIRSLIEKITDAITSNADDLNSDCIDTDSAEFSLNYDNRVELDSVGFDSGRVVDQVLDGVEDVIEKWFEKAFPESEEDEIPEGEVV
jgi:hypothetical protein